MKTLLCGALLYIATCAGDIDMYQIIVHDWVDYNPVNAVTHPIF